MMEVEHQRDDHHQEELEAEGAVSDDSGEESNQIESNESN